jgi:competence protein ComEA
VNRVVPRLVTRRLGRSVSSALVGLVALWMGAAFQPRALAQDAALQDPLPKGPGKETVESVCGVCHEVDTAIGTRRHAAEWQQMIDAMINRGAMGTDDEFKTVFEYLSRHFGVVNVNKAPATEIQHVLEVPLAEAEAIVRHREQHGEFKTVEEVQRVPGVDAKAMDVRKPRVAFK